MNSGNGISSYVISSKMIWSDVISIQVILSKVVLILSQEILIEVYSHNVKSLEVIAS